MTAGRQSASSYPARKRMRGWLFGLVAGIFVAGGCVVMLVPSVRAWLFGPDQPPFADLKPPTITEGKLPASLGQSWKSMDDPAKDGWETEVFNQKAGKTLKELAKVLGHPGKIEPQQLASLVGESFSCSSLIPADRRVVVNNDTFTIERAEEKKAGNASDPHRGSQGLADAIQDLWKPFLEAKNVRVKFKLFRIQRADGGEITTTQYFAISGQTAHGMIEQNATWFIRWIEAGDKPPLLAHVSVSQFEQVVYRHSPGPMFADCTRSVLEHNPCYKNQFLKGMNHWLDRSQDTRYFYLLGNPGLAVGDVNGDGFDDLYVCQEEGLPNRLFVQQKDGTATDVSEDWGVNWLHSSRSALLVDLDNDGDQDLAVAMVGCVVLATNEGDRFQIQTILSTDEDNLSLCSADYDNDGRLDLYVCCYYSNVYLEGKARGGLSGGAIASGLIENLNGGRNHLFRNAISSPDKWDFTDVTQEVGLGKQNTLLSMSASWEDFDNDGDQDLYVANDYGRNQLFRNDAGTFTEISSTTGSTDSAFGMSVSWGDYDRNGWMDLYVSNMFSAAGNRITFQDQFFKDSPNMKRRLQRFARGNTLLRNNGPKQNFSDESEASAVTMGRWAWGSNFVDVNNDGWEDLVVANGFLTTDDTGDL